MSLKAAIQSEKGVLGVNLQIASPSLAEICGLLGFDFVLLDAEHGPLGLTETEHMARAARGAGIGSIVRVPSHDPATIGQYLDCGVDGVMVSHIESAEEAGAVVSAARFPPFGARSVGRSRSLNYGLTGKLVDHARERDNELIVCALVEDRTGLANLTEIAAVTGINAIFLGAVDLALSLGFQSGPADPQVVEIIDRCVKDIAAVGVVAGVGVGTISGAQHHYENGARLLIVNVADLLALGAHDLVSFRERQSDN
jgi:4-hydroxy-2-oxoheptanedioate aldolase